jgi:uncharacterized protein YdaU (DUF1376 family)
VSHTQVDHYIPFFGRDFYASTAMWTAAEVGHYIRLLVIQWDSGALPAELERLELISPGISSVWELLKTKFPLCDDGHRRNARMEEHRAKAQELKAKRAESGRSGGSKSQANRKQTPKQTASKSQANGEANGQAKTKPPSPSPSSSLREEEHTHRTRDAGEDFGHPGWAAEEWDRFLAVWNATERAAKWTPLMAPAGWVDLAASPGWLERARQAMARLPRCKFFENPLAVTKFFEFVDRILAGEFDNAKKQRGYGQADEKPAPVAWKDQYQTAPYRRPKEVAAIASAVKLKEEDI